MNIVVATDLHGVTEPLREQFCNVFGAHDIVFLSPWDMELNPYPNEQAAHQAFLAQNGFEVYREKIAQAVASFRQEPIVLIGFSVGATAAWLSAADEITANVRYWLFYGSRIRDYLNAHLKTNQVTTIWAEHEYSFFPADVHRQLIDQGVSSELVPDTSHGFMNPCSVYYRKDLLTAYLNQIKHSI